jgi:hypothetical protein
MSALWTCPQCGHRFVTRNMWHSCTRHEVEEHFVGCLPQVRASFDRYIAAVEACGPIEVIAQKTRIAIMAQVRFAGCPVRKKWLLANLWLTRRAQHPRLVRIEEFGPGSYGHQFRLDSPADIDDGLRALIVESYRVGLREHLKRRSRTPDSAAQSLERR